MNISKGFRRLITVLSASILFLSIFGIIAGLDRRWFLWGVSSSAGIWVVYGIILYIIKGFADTNNTSTNQTPNPAKIQTDKIWKVSKNILSEMVLFVLWVLNKPIKIISLVSMRRWIAITCILAMAVAAFYSCTHMVGAGDTWVSIANGRHYINHGVNTVEPFNANSRKAGPSVQDVNTWPERAQGFAKIIGLKNIQEWHPTGFINHRWLGDIFFYWLTHISPFKDAETFNKPIAEQNISYNTLVYLKFVVYFIVITVIYKAGKKLGLTNVLAAISACAALIISRTFLDIRTVMFSTLFAAILILLFILTIYKNHRYIWLTVPLLVLWCNVYEGYIYYFLLFVPFVGLYFFSILPKRKSISLYFSLGWLLFYIIVLKFLSHEFLKSINPISDKLFYFILAAIAVSIWTLLKDTKAVIFYAYHIIVSLVVLTLVYGRFYSSSVSAALTLRNLYLFTDYVQNSREAFFTVIISFVVIFMLLSTFNQKLKTTTIKGWEHITVSAITALAAVIIFNPFHLANFTHAATSLFGKDSLLWKTVNEWHPAFEWANPVGNEIPFAIMVSAAILVLLFLVIWVLIILLARMKVYFHSLTEARKKKLEAMQLQLQSVSSYSGGKQLEYQQDNMESSENIYLDNTSKETPKDKREKQEKVELEIILPAVAATAIYFACRHRLFIPMAAIFACPIILMLYQNVFGRLVKITGLKKRNWIINSRWFFITQRVCTFIAVCLVLWVGIYTGMKYKTIYLDPWPDSSYLPSVFMRMTASYAKPFKACQFLRDNKMEGKVFNYWTEGGFIAYGQIPDPNTGKTPLQLYIDGRMYTAYDTELYQRWMYIMSGGSPVRDAERAGRSLTASDYEKIGKWVDEQLQAENVWCVFMPANQFDSALIKGLATNPMWRIAYIDDEQEIYVNLNNSQGLKLYKGIFDGQTKFPDEFSRLLTVGYNIPRLQAGDVNDAFGLLTKALNTKPSNTAAIELIRSSQRYPEFRGKLSEVFKQYFDNYLQNKQTYKKQDGYRERLIATMTVGNYLSKIDTGFEKKYKEYSKEFDRELAYIGNTSRW